MSKPIGSFVARELPEPYVIGDPGRSYHEIGGGTPAFGSLPNDTVCDGFEVDGWSMRAASVRGLMHRHTSTPRQDAYAIRYCPVRHRLVIAVCDGVGQARESHRAAAVAANCLAEISVECDPYGDDWTSQFTLVSKAIVDTAADIAGVARTTDAARAVMATTATVAVIDGVGFPGPWNVRTATVGDSAVWIAGRRGLDTAFGPWDRILGGKESGDGPAVTMTRALPLNDADRVAGRSLSLGADRLLLVCTDGIGDAFLNGAGEVAAALGSEWSSPPTALNFAAQASFGRRSHVDDRTAVAVWTPRG